MRSSLTDPGSTSAPSSSCRAWWTPTSTSTSPVAPSGRASTTRRAPRPPAASPRSWTCRSTACRPRWTPPRWRPSDSASTGQCWVDVGFWGGVVPGNAAQLEPLARAGALGFKCFLAPSGVDEFPHVGQPDLREALPIVARLVCRCSSMRNCRPSCVRRRPAPTRASYRTWLETRPARSETAAVELLVALVRGIPRARARRSRLVAGDAR